MFVSVGPCIYPTFLPFTDLGYLNSNLCVCVNERERQRIVVAVTLYTRIREISVRASYGIHDSGL